MNTLIKSYRIAQVQQKRRRHREELLVIKVEAITQKAKALAIRIDKYNKKIIEA